MLNLKRGIGTHEPSVISLGQVWVDIMLNVDKVPAQGGFAVADHPKPSIGGSYRVLQAASRMGVPTEHAGILGNGLWAHFIRQSFQDNGILIQILDYGAFVLGIQGIGGFVQKDI